MLSTTPAVGIRGQLEDGRDTRWCEPRLLEFATGNPTALPKTVMPVWDQAYRFTEHSYRGFGADPVTGSLFLSQQAFGDQGYHPDSYGQSYDWQAWCYRSGDDAWVKNGILRTPMRGC